MDSEYELLPHGSTDFPIGLHKSIVPKNPSIGENAKYQVLYAHWHSEFEFFYLSRGECVFVIDGMEYELEAGEAVFVPANAVHSAYRLSSESETVFYAAVFSRQLLDDGAGAISEKYISPVICGEMVINPVFRLDVPWQEEILSLLIEIMSLYDYTPYDSDPHSSRHPELFLREDAMCPELTIKSDLLKIWRGLMMHASDGEKRSSADSTNRERVQKAIEFMHSNYSERLTLEDIASSVFMSREYFSRVFKEHTGVSPFSYLTNYRISRSTELLEQTGLKIIEIAALCGFEQVSYFNRKFFEIVKCTPTQYRQGRLRV